MFCSSSVCLLLPPSTVLFIQLKRVRHHTVRSPGSSFYPLSQWTTGTTPATLSDCIFIKKPIISISYIGSRQGIETIYWRGQQGFTGTGIDSQLSIIIVAPTSYIAIVVNGAGVSASSRDIHNIRKRAAVYGTDRMKGTRWFYGWYQAI